MFKILLKRLMMKKNNLLIFKKINLVLKFSRQIQNKAMELLNQNNTTNENYLVPELLKQKI